MVAQDGQEQRAEQEGCELIDGPGLLEPVRRHVAFPAFHAGIVDEHREVRKALPHIGR
jgi:hypothetical protein